ncbi:MAG: glycoside hydrolase family 9 protein [Verrucomicrobia bacterium]|nr:glycoside hydrolase family 9 protein [Verrucomicrobiota bacterium]
MHILFRPLVRALCFSCHWPAMVAVAWLVTAARAATLPDFPLPVDQSRSATARRLAKPVLESRLLDDMESPATWKLFGPGTMTVTTERQRDGRQSVRLTSPTKTATPPPVSGRPFAETGLRREFSDEDWSAFNRLSVWVYPDLPGFHVVSLLMKLRSEGTEGRSYTDGGLNYVLLTNQTWNQVIWEIPHLERRQVKAVELIYRLQGNEPGATERVSFDFDRLELQRVEADVFRGWAVAAGRIAYNHLGYPLDAPKIAFAPSGAADAFAIERADKAEVLWRGTATLTRTPQGEFRVLDFSALRAPGRYRVVLGALRTEPFVVGETPWRETLIAGLNQFFCQRCGFAVPGIHGICHQDWQAEHAGRRIVINGGWHDAGDLSQGLVNTSEAAWSLLRLADGLPVAEAPLAGRLRQEARWGLEWMLKTRFGNGARVTWATMDFWTDGVTGNQDDVVVRANDSPFDNFIAAATEAAAGRSLRSSDAAFADRCLQAAEEDWRFALARLRDPGVEVAAAGVQAGLELFRATGRREFADEAIRLAGVLLDSQQVEPPPWDLPLTGFFHTSPRKDRILHYNHRSHEQAPAVALADLHDALPDAPERSRWRDAVARYGAYLKATAAHSAPWQMPAAGIYRLSDTRNVFEREQIQQGLRLAEGIYLRRFPVWGDFRGNLGVQLSQALAAARAARLLEDPELRALALAQVDWALGRNPFAQSLMYGVGHDYAPQYTAMSGDITGTLPVGIQTRLAEDVPYWPASNCYNYSEVWVHPVSRWLALLAELSAGNL